MTKCVNTSCNREARYVPKIYVPATGHPAVAKGSLAMVCGLPMCADHVHEVKPIELVPDLAALAGVGARASGSQIPPDISRAWVAPLRMDTEEYQTFKLMGELHAKKKEAPP